MYRYSFESVLSVEGKFDAKDVATLLKRGGQVEMDDPCAADFVGKHYHRVVIVQSIHEG